VIEVLAASYPLPPAARSAFLEHCPREIANLPELGDGVLHRTIVRVQRMYFDPPYLLNPANASKIQLRPWPPGEMAFHNH
jgi:hypothetical protein